MKFVFVDNELSVQVKWDTLELACDRGAISQAMRPGQPCWNCVPGPLIPPRRAAERFLTNPPLSSGISVRLCSHTLTQTHTHKQTHIHTCSLTHRYATWSETVRGRIVATSKSQKSHLFGPFVYYGIFWAVNLQASSSRSFVPYIKHTDGKKQFLQSHSIHLF
jgi:hypothetical protein